MLGRFFQRLEQGVERLPRQHVDFVDDINFESRAARSHVDVLPKLANLVDSAIAGAIDFQDVDVVAAADALADVALVAGNRRRSARTVQRLGVDPGRGGLADASGAGEQIGAPPGWW